MSKVKSPKYQITHHVADNGKVVTVARTQYAQKEVIARAMCDPADEYKPYVGDMLATLRCDVKIAKKRHKHNEQRLKEAMKLYEEASKEVYKLINYCANSYEAIESAKKDLERFEATINGTIEVE